MPAATPSEALSTRLRAYAGVTALVSQRSYPVIPTEDPTWPYNAIRVESGGGMTTLAGRSKTQRYVMVVSAYATTQAGAAALTKQNVLALHGYQNRADNVERCLALDDRNEDALEDGSFVMEQSFALWFLE
jgi:hypothetical protein